MELPAPVSQNVEDTLAENRMFQWGLNNYMQREPSTLGYPVMGQSQRWNTKANMKYWTEQTTPYMDNIPWWTINPNAQFTYWTKPITQHSYFTEETNQYPLWNIPQLNNMDQMADDTMKNNKPSWMSYKNNQFPWWQFKKNTPMKDWMQPNSSPMDDTTTNSWPRISKHFPMKQVEPESEDMEDNSEFTNAPSNDWTKPMTQHLDSTEKTNQQPLWNIKKHIAPMKNMKQMGDDTTKNNKSLWMSYKNNQFPWWQFKKNTPMKGWMKPNSSPMDDTSTNSWTRINKHFPIRQVEPEPQGMEDKTGLTHTPWLSRKDKTPKPDQVLHEASDTSKTEDLPVFEQGVITNTFPQMRSNYDPSQNMIDDEDDSEINNNNWKQSRKIPSMWWTKISKYNPRFNMMLQRTSNMSPLGYSPWWKCKTYPCFRQIDSMKHPLKIKTKEPVQGDEI